MVEVFHNGNLPEAAILQGANGVGRPSGHHYGEGSTGCGGTAGTWSLPISPPTTMSTTA